MTETPLLGHVRDFLERNGYEWLGPEVVVAGARFGFDGMMIAPRSGLGLVVLEHAESRRLLSKIAALSRALDFVQSRVSLTVVILGLLDHDTSGDLTSFARVLEVADLDSLERSLRTLLPIQEPEIAAAPVRPLEELEGRLDGSPTAGAYAEIARFSEVIEGLRNYVAGPILEVEEMR